MDDFTQLWGRFVKKAGIFRLSSEKTLLCSTGIGKLEDKLDPQRFMRVHRSYIIATAKIKKLESDGGGGFKGVLCDRSKIKISRSHAEKIKELLI